MDSVSRNLWIAANNLEDYWAARIEGLEKEGRSWGGH